MLKLCAFMGVGSKADELCTNLDGYDFETQRMLTDVASVGAKRYYFGNIRLVPGQIRLSLTTANKLSPQLAFIKRKLGFTFINFEDASVVLEPFARKHTFETGQFLMHSVVKHFKDVSTN